MTRSESYGDSTNDAKVVTYVIYEDFASPDSPVAYTMTMSDWRPYTASSNSIAARPSSSKTGKLHKFIVLYWLEKLQQIFLKIKQDEL